jgi:hypothetical protein
MQQRRLRLGDIVDDYCPRERRITNHAIVAMVEDAVKQTRCTTCDADHEYKGAKVPPQRRKKDSQPGLVPDAVTAIPRKRVTVETPSIEDSVPVPQAASQALDLDPAADISLSGPVAEQSFNASEGTDESPAEHAVVDDDEGPVHRPLIRATLPRPEGHVPERKEPEFTAHQRGDANSNRHGRGRRGQRHGQGRGPQGGGAEQSRFGSGSARSGQAQRHGSGFGQRHGSGQGQGHRQNSGRPGHRSGQGRPGGGGRKRGR